MGRRLAGGTHGDDSADDMLTALFAHTPDGRTDPSGTAYGARQPQLRRLPHASPTRLLPARRCLSVLCLSTLRLSALWCAAPLAADEVAWFVRDGIIASGSPAMVVKQAGALVDTRRTTLPDGRQWLRFAWTPNTPYELCDGPQRRTETAPRLPSPVRVLAVPLEDVHAAAAAGTSPDCIVRFAPDGRRLAIGSFHGWLRVVDVYTGDLLARRRIAVGMVKQLAWSPDGRILYVGEQSPDAQLLALAADDAGTSDLTSTDNSSPAAGTTQAAPAAGDALPHRRPSLDVPLRDLPPDRAGRGSYRVIWQRRLADDLGTNRPDADDRFGVYTLPAVFDLHVARDGRLIVAGVHSWVESGQLHNRTVLYCLSADGALLWRLPEQGAWPLTVMHLGVDDEANRVLLLASQSQPPNGRETLRTDTLYLLNGRTGQSASHYRLEPMRPHFERIESWDSVALSPDGARAAVGLSDGRALLFDTSDGQLMPLAQFDLATPVVVGGLPLTAAASYTRIYGERLFLQTQNTHVSFGSAQAAHQAPAAHRGANTLTVAGLDGQIRWRYRGPFALTGHWTDRSLGDRGRWLLVTCRELPGAAAPDNFGCLLFDLERRGGGSERLTYYYPTVGPVAFHADLSADGRFAAVVETPAPTPDGLDVYGTYQVHIIH